MIRSFPRLGGLVWDTVPLGTLYLQGTVALGNHPSWEGRGHRPAPNDVNRPAPDDVYCPVPDNRPAPELSSAGRC